MIRKIGKNNKIFNVSRQSVLMTNEKKRKGRNKNKFVVPETLKFQILKHAHD